MVERNPSRRSLLAALPVCAAAAISPAVATALPSASSSIDAHLCSLEERRAALVTTLDHAYDRWFELEDVCADLYPPAPREIYRRQEDLDLLEFPRFPSRRDYSNTYTGEEIKALRKGPRKRRITLEIDFKTGETWPEGTAPRYVPDAILQYLPYPEGQARAEEIMSAWNRHDRACSAIKEQTGFAEVDRTVKRLTSELAEIDKVVIDTSATSLTGLSAKLKLAEAMIDLDEADHPDKGTRLLYSIARDLRGIV